MNWHSVSAQQAIEILKSDQKMGLDASQVKSRKIKYGKNELIEEKKSGFCKKLFAQFSDFMVITLIMAAIISFITSFLSHESDYIDAVIILGIVVINAIIGVMQESRAEKEIDSLKRLSTPLAKVLRSGKIRRIPSRDVVPGDILRLSAGDLVCADARILQSSNLAVEESAMTGESFAVEKNESKIFEAHTSLADRKNMLFAGSVIDRGNASAVVAATGMSTEMGKVAALIGGSKRAQTPLQSRLAATGKITAICIMATSLAVFLMGISRNSDFMEIFMISISLAVAAIPEGLPAVVTIVLAGGVRRMAKKGAVVRNLPAVETLGHASIICSDKTGTLTLSKMTVTQIQSALKQQSLKGNFAKKILTFGALCNNSVVFKSHGEFVAQGEPTENALLMAACNCGISKKTMDENYLKVFELPFDSKRKLMSTVHKYDGHYVVSVKGAPEILVKACTHYESEKGAAPISQKIINQIEKANILMASQALRVIAVAYKTSTQCPYENRIENELVFCGLVGIIDPPRPEAKRAVKECKNAGIKPVMITGDNIETAKKIAQEVGILSNGDKVITGQELSSLSDEELEKSIDFYCVFARVSPEHKVRIVKALQKKGNVVAMTGDGVNDAPALKAADIGCAMGKCGTDAAKSASDMIITDDNFATIVEAVKQGRGMFENIKKTVHFLISTNIGEVMVVLFGFLMRAPSPLLAIHLLWINLVTDAFPALALGMDPLDETIMLRPPISPKKSLFANGLGYNIVVEGCFIASLGILSYIIGRTFFDINSANPIIGRTMAFLTLGLSQLIHSFNVQSKKSLFETGLLSNPKLIWSVTICMLLEIITVTVPSLTEFFKTQPLDFLQWGIVIALSICPIVVSEIEKYFWSKEITVLEKLKFKN